MITATHLTTSDGGLSGGTSFNTASITPSANKLVLLAVWSDAASGTPNVPTVSGNGLTWVQVATWVLDYDSTRRMTIFRAMGSSPSAGAVTVDFAGQTQTFFSWSISEFDGVAKTGTNGSDAVVQSVKGEQSGTYTGMTVTLGAFANAANAAWGYILNGGTNAISSGSGFTELSNINTALGRSASEFKINDTTVDWSWSSQNNNSQAIAVEIQSARAIKKVNGVVKASIKKIITKHLDSKEFYYSPLFNDSAVQAYWRLNGDFLDSGPNGYNLSVGNAPSDVTGRFYNGKRFTRTSSQSASIADVSCPNLEISGSQTWMFWLYPVTMNATNLCLSKTAGGVLRQVYVNSANKINFDVGSTTPGQIVSDMTLSVNTWNHIVCMVNSTTNYLTVVINGVAKSVSYTGSLGDTNAPFYMGRDAAGNYCDAIIDDAVIMSRVLTESEYLSIYNPDIKKYMGVNNI